MSEYKRMTERDEWGNADIIGVDSGNLQGNLMGDEFNRVTLALNRFADLEDKIESGRMVELPCIAMIEQGIVDGKFKPTKEAQQFNGRHAVVYIDKSKYKIPLIDICWNNYSKYDHYAAEARLKELNGE